MKATKFLAIALAMFIFVSCKKNDFQDIPSNQESVGNAESSVENSSFKATFSDWKIVSTWSNDKKDGFTKYSGSISDSAITSDIANNGLVLLFTNTGSTKESLPYNKRNIEWYYQVTTGSISILANAFANSSINKNQSFSYVVLSKDELGGLEGKGITKSQLMNSTYQNVADILQ